MSACDGINIYTTLSSINVAIVSSSNLRAEVREVSQPSEKIVLNLTAFQKLGYSETLVRPYAGVRIQYYHTVYATAKRLTVVFVEADNNTFVSFRICHHGW